ncbi:MAG: hypothetical protein NC541_05430 [bacterium]|nr:hypothetical protein [bacterium]
MKKKLLSILLCGAMIGTMLTACGNNETPNESGSSTPSSAESSDQGEVTPVEVTPEALPAAAFAHYTFDGDDEGYTAVTQATKADDSANDGANYDLVPVEGASFYYADGAVGKALFLDGSYGLDLNLQPTNTDVYTVSFWLNAKFFFQYGPTLQIGYNIGKADNAGNNVTWMNITESTWGAGDALIFPMIWSRNEASDAQDGTDCWPWMYAWDDSVHGKQEWIMITVVSSGEKQDGATGATTVGAQYYLNGQLMYDSQDNYTNHTYWEEWTWDATLAPNIMKPGDSEFEAYIGVNYWDPMYIGYVDDLYVYDTALTAGQVLSLYQMGDPSVAVEYPDSVSEPAEPEAVDHSDVVITGTQVGATDCSSAFFKEFSEIVAVPSGESVTVNFKNYSSRLNNWNNFSVVLQNVAEGHTADETSDVPYNPDYKEYAVMRADNWGWGVGYDNIATAACDWNWDTFTSDIDGADVALTITNNGDTADVVAVVTTTAGTVYNQSYTGIAVDGDLYYCLTVDGSFIDIQQ